MPQAIPFLPLIASGVGAATAIGQGIHSSNMNNQAMAASNQATAQQQQLIQNLMAGISPQAYHDQAAQAGQDALSQLSSNFAQRGMLSSGALHTAGAQTLSKLYTDANARYQQDRQNAIGMALGGYGQIRGAYDSQVNPSPYAGLGAALGGMGTAAGSYLFNQQQAYAPTPYTTPVFSNPTPAPLPGFGSRYRP